MAIRCLHRDVSLAGLACLLSFAAASPAGAETVGCTAVPPLPTVITNPGHYCLTADVAKDFGDSNGLRVQADDTVVDCNGHSIRHTAPAGHNGHGINIGDDKKNVTVRNCVVDGFYVGISVIQSFGQNNATTRVLGNTVVNSRFYGILGYGSNLVFEGNRVDHVLGNATAGGPIGILLNEGNGSIVRGNTVTDIRPDPPASAGLTMGIYLNNVHDTVIEDNVLAGLTAYTGNGVYAIYGNNTSGIAANRNVIVSPPAPGTPPHDGGNYYAIFLNGDVASNVCRDNVIGHYNTNVSGCTGALNTEY
jgi:hypothetical protein